MNVEELKQFESVYQPSKEITYCWGVKKYVQLCLEQDYTDIVNHANKSLRIWQAAKSQAIPEGFVLVPKEPTFRMSWVYQMKSVAPISSLSVNGYKAMIEAAQEKEND